MFEMQHPWWEFVVRAGVVYAALLVLVRLTGKRSIGQFTPFDLVVVMLLAEAVSGSVNGQDASLAGGLIAAATLIVINVVIGYLTSRSGSADALIEGRPVLIGRDGEVYRDTLKRERVSVSEFEQALRENNCAIEDMHMAVLEADGKISILKREKPASA
ncbi:MAG: DUF421 domain-containing protein [Burkholderiales bacterium]|nr:DUF421 domain-containing protein [Burkholderiales bacterium]